MSEYEGREQGFNASLGTTMGTWMLDLAKADVSAQAGLANIITDFFTPDKDGKIPTVDLGTKLDFGGDDKTESEIDVTFPVGLYFMGERFAADTAELDMNMNVSASTLDQSSEQGKGSGSATFGVAGIGVNISVSMSVSATQKRESDYRSTTSAKLTMKREPAPEPILRVLDAYTEIIGTQCEIAKAEINQTAEKVARAKGLMPKDNSGGGGGGGNNSGGGGGGGGGGNNG